MTLLQSDHFLSAPDCSGLVTVGDSMKFISKDRLDGKLRKKRRGSLILFRYGMSLCRCLSVIILLTGNPVRAQPKKDDTMPPSGSTPAQTEATPAPSFLSPPTVTPDPPTAAPTIAPTNPTFSPTQTPTTSSMPSVTSSISPSLAPTVSFKPTGTPSVAPTTQPTFENPSMKETKFLQAFYVGNGREFTADEIQTFELVYRLFTPNFSPDPDPDTKVTSSCDVTKQKLAEGFVDRRLRNGAGSNSTPQALRTGRHLQDEPVNQNLRELSLTYTMKYVSSYYNVTTYPMLFQNWTANNLDVIVLKLQTLSLNVTTAFAPKRVFIQTPAPTESPAPSDSPTILPTFTVAPVDETMEPTALPSENPNKDNKSFNNIIIISVSLIIAASIIVVGVYVYYQKQQKSQNDGFGANATETIQGPEIPETHGVMEWADSTKGAQKPIFGTSSTKAYGSSFGRHSNATSGLADVVSSPPGSLVSSQSLISRGNSMGGDSREEEDTAHILVDEFDQYKDQNLEKMRADIEDLPACDGMMSQAVAKALIDQDDETLNLSSYWGGDHDITAAEIEASALGVVLDWLKRNGKVSDRERREIMQEQLNKMTASVLHKVIGPDDATRTIHECAVLLGLKLASELSVTTILISGMRKKATEADIRRTFSAFGDIVVAAVAPNEKGFGIVRYKSINAVNRAMSKFRNEEVVVEDVAVQLIVIKAGYNFGDMKGNGSTEII